MEAQRLPCPPVSLDDQPVQLSCLQAIPAASSLSLSPVILQPEQAHSQTIYLKALTIPLFQPIQSECLQPNNQLPMGRARLNLESTNMPLILSPLLPSEGTDQPQALTQKLPRAINIINGLPVLPQSSPCAALGSPGKSKSAGKYLCKHCGRDCLKPSVLEKHMRSHTGERPFPCTTCGIAFKTQSNLYKHRRTQTHVNNAKLPSEPDSGSPLEENEKVTECIGSSQMAKDRNCDHTRGVTKQAISESIGVVTSEKHPPESSWPTGNVFALVSESQWMTADSSWNGGINQSILEKEAMKDPENPLQRRKVQEERSPTISRHSQLQRQQATYSDKLWDSRSADYKLKKCESTDSGYLSRSDSVEQPMLSPSPLHSLCEHSTESEGEAVIGSLVCMASSSSRADLPEKATGALELEKKKLEEHISKLISHNKVVVDDSQLDTVRPRKTVLSKQGSIDLPMPYTYKDSFHFDIRPLDPHRKKNLSLCSAKSTFTPVEKPKPLFFHSVPTQFSTTIDCVPVTRSNSLPFVECTRRVQDQMDSSKLSCYSRTPPSTSGSGLLLSDNFAAGATDFPNSHPRALVRQVAVDDLPLSHVTESPPSVEEVRDLKKPGSGGEGANPKSKKSSQRKLKMFSQEKWQVYGDETFKKIYQKMKINQTTKKQKGNNIQDLSSVHSDTKEPASHEGITVPKDGNSSTTKTLVPSPAAIFTKLNAEGSEGHSISSSMSQSVSSQESSGSFAELMETSHSVSNCEHGRVTQVVLERRCSELHASRQEPKGNFQIMPLRTDCELTLQFRETKDRKDSNPLNTASLQSCSHGLEEKYMQGGCIKCVPLLEDISTNKEEEEEDPSGKESSQFAQVALPRHPCNTGKLVQESHKLPSERKKLKVDELKNKENGALSISLSPNNSADRVVKLPDHCQAINIVAPVSKSHSVKGEKQTAVTGMNVPGRSMECTDAVQHLPVTSSNRDDIADFIDTADMSALSFSEQLRAEVTKEYICSSYPLQELTEKPRSIITGTGKSSQSGDVGLTPSSIQHLKLNPVTLHLEKNEFLPKYILRHSQGRNSTGMSLAAGEQENMPCISLPTPSTDSTSPARNDRLHGTNPADVFLCPLQLELSHLTRAEELKWDASTTWKSLVACSPAILETTSITTRVDWKCPHQWPKKIKKDIRKGANDRDNLGDPKPAQEQDGGVALCPSHVPGRKICFTSMHTGGILISSDMTGQSSTLQLLHSGNSSIISVSSLVERATLCGNADKPMKEQESDASSLPRLQDDPACSADTSRCLCHSSDMLYCHVLCCPQKGLRTLSQLTMASCAGNSKAPSLSISFPSLNAEPQLTWCCLTRNLPLPCCTTVASFSLQSSLVL